MDNLLGLLVFIWLLAATVGALFGVFTITDAYDDEDVEFGARIILGGVFFPLVLPFLIYLLFKKANLLLLLRRSNGTDSL